MAFPTDRLDFKCEIAFGVDPNGVAFINPISWSDVSPYFLDQSITINRGRANETDDTQVMSMEFELDNNEGLFTPDNAESILYPYVRRGTIMRYGVYGGDSYFQYQSDISSVDVALTTPDNAALDITGDIEFAFQVQPYAVVSLMPIISKYRTTGDQRSYYVFAQPHPDFPTFYRIGIEWSTGGTSGTAFVAATEYIFSYHSLLNVKITMDVNNGAGGHTIQFFTARKWGEDWDLISQTIGVGTTSIFSGSAPLEIAGNAQVTDDNFLGKVYRAQIRNGIGGTLVANVDTRALTPGTTGFTDSAGRVWTVGAGGVIDNLHERFFGNIDSWRVVWPNGDTTGTQEPESRVVCQASSVRRRLGQGNRPLSSPVKRYITGSLTSGNVLVGYWPFEDEIESTSIANGIANQPVGVINSIDQITFGETDVPAGSAPLVNLGLSFEFNGEVNTYIAGSPVSWAVSSLMKILNDVSIPTVLMEVYMTSGTVGRFEFSLDSTTQYRVRAYGPTGAILDEAVGNHSDLYVGKWGNWVFNATQSGANIIYSMQWYREDNVTTTPNFGGASTFAGTLGNVDRIRIPPGSQLNGSSLGHVNVVIGTGTVYGNSNGENALTGFAGEPAVQRFSRICAEENIAQNYGTMPNEHSTDLGPQPIDSLLDILQDTASSANSIFLDARFFRGLQYIPLYDMLDISVQMALDAEEEHITNPLSPTLDDQFLRNAVESSRPNGSTYLAQDEASIDAEGEYLTQVTVNVERDDQLGDDANWRLHLGVSDEMAYPPITIELAKAPDLIPIWLHDQTDVGCLITLDNLPRQADSTTKLFLLQGYTETLTPTKWTLTLNCTPYEPYMVTWFDNDFVALKLSPENSSLDASVNTVATSIVVNLNGTDQWTTDPLDMPILIELAGEQMNVTAISAVASGKQTFTVTRSVNGVVKSHTAGEQVVLAYPAYLSLV